MDPKDLTLEELLAKRLFRIPPYQRAYSWQSEHRRDMFEDISKLKGRRDSFHFMSTVVGLRCELEPVRILTDRYNIIEVVDGQQRLTTLVLLLKAIERKCACSPATHERALAHELQKLLVKGDEERLILLQTNHDRSQYFANFLRSGECSDVEQAQTLADQELLKAIVECQRFVDKWEDCIDLLDIVKNQLRFIFHEIDDKAAVYTVFEVLNNRGRQVSSLDKLKNMLMAITFEDNQGETGEHIDELHDIWGKIYRTIGLHQGLSTESLRFGATLWSPFQISKPFGEEKAVESLTKKTNASTAGAKKVSNWLLKVTEAVNQFLEDMNHSREAATKIAHARLLAVAILLRKFPSDEEKMLLDYWEKTSFRIFGLCQKDARTGVGDYVRLAWATWNNALDADDISERIKELGNRKGLSINDALPLLEDSNCYEGWEDKLRYLLFRYEEHLATQQGQRFRNEQWNRIWEESAAQSIEHILPQSRRWREGISVDRLGNLLLLPPGLNSQLGNQDPEDKANAYVQTGLFSAAEVAQTIREEGWGAPQIEERERKILAWIRETWG